MNRDARDIKIEVFEREGTWHANCHWNGAFVGGGRGETRLSAMERCRTDLRESLHRIELGLRAVAEEIRTEIDRKQGLGQ